MSAKHIVEEIFAALRELPIDKVVQVRDFAVSLKRSDGEKTDLPADYAWTEEELRELTGTVWDYGNQTIPFSGSQ